MGYTARKEKSLPSTTLSYPITEDQTRSEKLIKADFVRGHRIPPLISVNQISPNKYSVRHLAYKIVVETGRLGYLADEVGKIISYYKLDGTIDVKFNGEFPQPWECMGLIEELSLRGSKLGVNIETNLSEGLVSSPEKRIRNRSELFERLKLREKVGSMSEILDEFREKKRQGFRDKNYSLWLG